MYKFSTNWFSHQLQAIWAEILLAERPTKLLEVGSFEGLSTVFMIQTLGNIQPIELHCVDTWQGGREHTDIDFHAVQENFTRNIQQAESEVSNAVNLQLYPVRSDVALPVMQAQLGQEYFDFIYIDGSHEAADVLYDAVNAFKLLRSGGVMVFDDYLWHNNPADIIRAPKIAIDAFVNTNFDKLQVYGGVPYQLIVKKL